MFRHRALLLEYKPLPFDSVRRLESEKKPPFSYRYACRFELLYSVDEPES